MKSKRQSQDIAKSKSKPAQTAKGPSNALVLTKLRGETKKRAAARFATLPSLRGAMTVARYGIPAGLKPELGELINHLEETSRQVVGGDLQQIEQTMAVNVNVLDALFHKLTVVALSQGQLDGTDRLMRLALRAQSQARATAETLALMKNPPNVAFVRAQQANLTTGAQQVNNGTSPGPGVTRARESDLPQSKLLEHKHGEGLDAGAAQATVAANPPLEAVATVNGTADARGQNPGEPERLQGRASWRSTGMGSRTKRTGRNTAGGAK